MYKCDHLVKSNFLKKNIYFCKKYDYSVINNTYDCILSSCLDHSDLSCYENIKTKRKNKLLKIHEKEKN